MHHCQASRAFVPTLTPLFDQYRVFHGQASDLQSAASFLEHRMAYAQSRVFVSKTQSRHEPSALAQVFPTFSSLKLKPVWVLNDFFVSPEARGQGEARALLKYVIEQAKQHEVCRISLATLRDNYPAQQCFTSLGWRPDQRFSHFNLEF